MAAALPIAPVIPRSAGPGARGHSRPGMGCRLPVAAVPVVPAAPADVVYGFGRIDASGRLPTAPSPVRWAGGPATGWPWPLTPVWSSPAATPAGWSPCRPGRTS